MVNATCLRLASGGQLVREPRAGLLINQWPSGMVPEMVLTPISTQSEIQPLPWFWEGNVQAAVVDYLVRSGWSIHRVADTASHEAGHDIEAERDDAKLWVTAKGFPSPTARTQPATQARHWFAGAILDIALWRQEAPQNVQLGVALPEFQTYQSLAERTRWLASAAPFAYLWVAQSGTVRSDLHGT
jgi:hypothetical protein